MLRKIAKLIRNPKIVVYTDGSCTKNGRVNARGGIGVFYDDTSTRNISIPFDDAVKRAGFTTDLNPPTNNKTELLAVLLAIKMNELFLSDGNSTIVIKTDSRYVIDSFTLWYHTWLKNDWVNANNKPVSNKEIIEKVIVFILKYKSQITFSHVKAHMMAPLLHSEEYADWHGNNMADRLATLASSIKK